MSNLKTDVLAFLPNGCKVESAERHGETNWSTGYKVKVRLPNGDVKAYFIKVVDNELGDKMVLGEYEGQKALRDIIPNNIPLPVAHGVSNSDRSKHIYVAEFHHMAQGRPTPKSLISLLRQLHQHSVSPTGKFGFSFTTYKGYFPLQVDWCDSWEEFFTRQFRAELTWEASVRGKNEKLEQLANLLFDNVIPRLLRPLQNWGRSIEPVLCHGDLWYGNVEIDVNTKELIVYDSCAVYAHSEYDLSLFRAPRYLSKCYLDEYKNEIGVSEPAEDFDDRNALYSLRNDIVVSALWDKRSVELRNTSIKEMRRLIAKYPDGIRGFKK